MVARRSNLLTHKQVQSLTEAGVYADGSGLYLIVRPSRAKAAQARPPSKSWVFVYFRDRRRCELGLGGAADVRLADVRARAEELRRIVQAGGDPKAKAEPERVIPTFGHVADDVVEKLSWRNAKTRHQWDYSLRRQAKALRDTPVDQVSTDHVVDVLKPVWSATPESGRRLRGRIEAVLDAAAARDLRTGANPARWRRHLSHLLPAPSAEKRHFPAMPYAQVGGLLERLRGTQGMSALVLRFTILTAARSGEAFGARVSEIDPSGDVWMIPGARMKAGLEHRVPLVGEARAIAEEALGLQRHLGPDAYLFPGAKRGRPLSIMAMDMALRRAGEEGATVHGFRSSFRDWAGEETDHPREVIEAALAHVISNKVERAYRRGDALAKRRLLMADWDAYLRPPSPAPSPCEEEAPPASRDGSAPGLSA